MGSEWIALPFRPSYDPLQNAGNSHWPVSSTNWRRSSPQTLSATPVGGFTTPSGRTLPGVSKAQVSRFRSHCSHSGSPPPPQRRFEDLAIGRPGKRGETLPDR